jgi:hypothetical protein
MTLILPSTPLSRKDLRGFFILNNFQLRKTQCGIQKPIGTFATLANSPH